MLSQQRYRTLISSVGKIYSADDTKVRTELLEGALCSVMGIMNPETDAGWRTVSADTDRILRVWESLEESPAAQVVVEQFKDMLRELSSASMEVDDEMSGAAPTTGVMTFQDISSASTIVLTPTAQRTPILHRSPALSVASHRSSVPFITLEPPVVVTVHSQPASVASTAPPSPMLTSTEEADDVDMVPPSTAASVEPVVEQPDVSSTTESAPPTVTQAAVSTTSDVVVAPEPDIEQPAEEEDAAVEEESEEGVEMEQILIRGRTYWFDRDAGKLYAITEDDDIGDEVGEFKGGKVVFYAK